VVTEDPLAGSSIKPEDPLAGSSIEAEWSRLRTGGAVLLEGFHAVKHALRFGASVPLIVTSGRAAVLALADALAPDLVPVLDAQLVEVDRATFERLSSPGAGHHTGVIALARRAAWQLGPLASAERTAPLVFLDDPRHLGNYGAVIRVAAGLGAAGVVSTGSVDPWHGVVVRGAAGLQFAVPVLRVPDIDVLDGPLVALDAGGRDARGFVVPANAILAFGSERRGLSPGVRRRAAVLLALPMRTGVASYNLASAVAMVLYQWLLGSPAVARDQP
jgi:RNA methyltransferase, TrmH family